MITTHDPDAVLDYQYDWTDWLTDGDTITAATVTVETGDVVIDSTAHDTQKVTVWVSGGTAGMTADLVCHVTTQEGREDDRTIRLYVANR